MRYSNQVNPPRREIPPAPRPAARRAAAPRGAAALAAPGADDFFRAVAQDSTAQTRKAGILLVGGISSVHLTVRGAQSMLRMDQLPSDWSHAALVLRWDDPLDLTKAIGAEVTLEPNPGEQVPEENGVTLFPLSRYADAARYPNLAFLTVVAVGGKGALSEADLAKARETIVRAALEPNRERPRYRFWEWLGAWHAYLHAPGSVRNPLAQGIPHPGASFVEYAYEAGGLDVTPGATDPNSCPELLWATAKRWAGRVSIEAADVRYWMRRGDQTRAAEQEGPSLCERFERHAGRAPAAPKDAGPGKGATKKPPRRRKGR